MDVGTLGNAAAVVDVLWLMHARALLSWCFLPPANNRVSLLENVLDLAEGSRKNI